MYEKKLVILIGRKSERGTLKLERSSLGLHASINAFALLEGDYMLAVTTREARYDYPLGALPGEAAFEIDGEIKIDEAHFTVYERGGEAVLYGTLSRERIWWGNLPSGRGRVEEKTVSTVIEKEAEQFSFSKAPLLAQGG